MFKQLCTVLIFCSLVTLVLYISVAEAKSTSKKTRRRCPNVCLRRIRKLERKRVSQGAQGIPGPPGPPGPQGSIVLPACKIGEYLTSDGNNLRCEKLNLDGVCSYIKNECQSDKAPKVIPTPDAENKMVKFMKKNMFQSIEMDGWDVEVFEVDGSLFFGLSQLGRASFQIYKWITDSFKSYESFKMLDARNWEPFKIGGELYFVVATMTGTTCPMIHYDKSDQTFKKVPSGLACNKAFDVKLFKLNGEQYIVVANHRRGYPVVISKWQGSKFTETQRIPITAIYVEAMDVNGDVFIGISGSSESSHHVFLYKWNGKEFVRFQIVFTVARPYEMAGFEAGGQEFISIATMGTSASGGKRDSDKLLLLRWNGTNFESFQNITSYGARRLTALSSPLMGKETTYLAVINQFRRPEIYSWVGDSSTKFDKLQEVEAKNARDATFFTMGDNVYLLVSSHKRIGVFRGEMI